MLLILKLPQAKEKGELVPEAMDYPHMGEQELTKSTDGQRVGVQWMWAIVQLKQEQGASTWPRKCQPVKIIKSI